MRVISLLALSDSGAPAYDHELAAALVELGVPAFACTPDAFPDLLAVAIGRGDVAQWAAEPGVVTRRAYDVFFGLADRSGGRVLGCSASRALALGLSDSMVLGYHAGPGGRVRLRRARRLGSAARRRPQHGPQLGLVGLTGTVVKAIPERVGEISVVVSGHLTKLTARCDEAVPTGHAVIIDAVLSPTSVSVTPRML